MGPRSRARNRDGIPGVRVRADYLRYADVRTETREVLVDAAATDQKGGFVRDLSRGEIHLFENGKEQPIRSSALAANAAVAARNPHFIALAVDAGQPGLSEQLLNFIGHYSAPDRYIALYSR